MDMDLYKIKLVALDQFRDVNIRRSGRIAIPPSWMLPLNECMRGLQEAFEAVAPEKRPTVYLTIRRNEGDEHGLILSSNIRYEESTDNKYQKSTNQLVESTVSMFMVRVKLNCAFCSRRRIKKYSKDGLERCRLHQYIGLEDIHEDTWPWIYGDGIDATNHLIGIMLRAHRKWNSVIRNKSDNTRIIAASRRNGRDSTRRLVSPAFVDPFALRVLFRKSYADDRWIRKSLGAAALCDAIKAGYALGVDTLPMLVALCVSLLLETGDTALPLSVAEGLIVINHHHCTANQADWVRAITRLEEGLWTPTDFAGWLENYMQVDTEGETCAA